MTDFNQNIDEAKDMLNLEDKDMQKLPQMLNVLTILTYIGCAIALIASVWNYFTVAASYKIYSELSTTDGLAENNAASKLLSGASDIMKKSYENRTLILVFALVGAALCFYGAMQMRNLKKQGYLIYVVGEILPIVSFIIFIGFGSIFGGAMAVLSSLFAIVFIILYTTQRKHLVN
jgi:hypothetical protein